MEKEARKESAPQDDFEVAIPSSILKDRSVSVLEAIVEYLKEKKRMRYADIGELLNRDERTIWTAYNRVKKKRESARQDEGGRQGGVQDE